jgi:transposase
LIPAAKSGGRPRTMDMRAAMNAIFYLLRTGCPWRYLPRGPFPPRSTVYNIFRQFRRDGVWERIWEELHMALREALDREASPTAAILDSQSLKAAMARPRQDPPALSMAGTYLGRRRLQRPSGQGCRGQIAGAPLEIVKRTDDIKGFVVLPRRWVVERTFSWFGRNRRLAKDYQNLAETLAAFVTLAAIQFAIRRLARR